MTIQINACKIHWYFKYQSSVVAVYQCTIISELNLLHGPYPKREKELTICFTEVRGLIVVLLPLQELLGGRLRQGRVHTVQGRGRAVVRPLRGLCVPVLIHLQTVLL